MRCQRMQCRVMSRGGSVPGAGEHAPCLEAQRALTSIISSTHKGVASWANTPASQAPTR